MFAFICRPSVNYTVVIKEQCHEIFIPPHFFCSTNSHENENEYEKDVNRHTKNPFYDKNYEHAFLFLL